MSVRICGDIVTPSAIIRNGAIVVGGDGLIEAVEAAASKADFDYTGYLITPGFVDVHVHGGGGADFMDGRIESVRLAARTHALFGTTTLLATTLTAAREQISACIAAVCEVIENPLPDEAEIAGIHLEGPYICAAKRGAQPLGPIRPPDWDEMKGWIDQSGGRVKLITMAPEIDGALEFIGKASAAGVMVSIGHTNASYEQAIAGIDAGASNGTHLFNAMPPLAHRAPGAAGALLAAEGATVELIADGVHLHPAVVRLAVSAKGADGVILVTDAISTEHWREAS
jgi:N-acetylglucosamine-6-phosphate deacetylase